MHEYMNEYKHANEISYKSTSETITKGMCKQLASY